MGTVPPPDQALTRRVGGLLHKWQCHLCPWHTWHVQLCPNSIPFAPQATLGLSGSRVSGTHVSMPCQRVREKGKSCVTSVK